MSSAGAATAATSPVFVFGADHSGTTILYRMLAYHRDLTWLSQFSLRGGEIPGRSRRPANDRLDGLLRVMPHPWRKESPRFRRLFVPEPGEEGAVWNHLLEGEGVSTERLHDHLTAFSARHGGRRVLAKRPSFYRHLDLLRAAFPGARFVHIVRDGRPVALSVRAKAVSVARCEGGPPDPDDALRAAARFWLEVLGRADQLSADERIEVRYEDLCADVHGTIRSILRHVALDLDPFPFQRCPATLSSRNSAWVERASARELEEVSRIQSAALIRRGYPIAAPR